jgi:hypothetical protein
VVLLVPRISCVIQAAMHANHSHINSHINIGGYSWSMPSPPPSPPPP